MVLTYVNEVVHRQLEIVHSMKSKPMIRESHQFGSTLLMQTERQIIMHGVNKAFLIKLGQIKDKKIQLCNNTYQNP